MNRPSSPPVRLLSRGDGRGDHARAYVEAYRSAGVTLPLIRPITFPDAPWYWPIAGGCGGVVTFVRAGCAAIGLAVVVAGSTAGCWSRPRVLPGDAATPLVYVALGDSTVEGIGATSPEHTYVGRLHQRLSAVYPKATAANLGVAGATSDDVIAAQLGRAVELAPHLVTLSIGPNDITTGVEVTRYERNIDTILGRLTGETSAVLVVNLLPDLAVTPRFRASRRKELVARQTALFNEALDRRGRAHGAELVDLYAASREEVPLRPELIAGDGYHPSDAGHARWAELMWKGVENRMATR